MNFCEKTYSVPAGAGPVPAILDTDTYNEIDDQFALVYALLSPESIELRGVTAAPFFNSRSTSAGDGMEKSYQEIVRIVELMSASSRVEITMSTSRTPLGANSSRDASYFFARQGMTETTMRSSGLTPIFSA